MLDQDANKRPTLKEILERIKASESSSKDIRKVFPQLEEKKISGPEQRNYSIQPDANNLEQVEMKTAVIRTRSETRDDRQGIVSKELFNSTKKFITYT